MDEDRKGWGEDAMQITLTIPERFKDLRVEKGLTLEQLSTETGISKSALGKYETDAPKDMSSFNVVKLAKFYEMSTDYLLCVTENKNHPDTELDALHLSDAAVDVLKTDRFNHRLLSELICHKNFRRFMLDAEIYADRIADRRINDMNTVLEAARQMILPEHGEDSGDLYLHTLKTAQLQEKEYFGRLVTSDLKVILRDIREAHRADTTTADNGLSAAAVQEQLINAMSFEGSSEEKKMRSFLAPLGIDYDKLSREQLVTLIDILKLSKHMKSPISPRGRSRPYQPHGKGKKKRR